MRDITDSDSLEIRYRYKVKGEKWGFHRTEILKDFPFPVAKGCRYIPESIVWSAIARQFKTRYVNEYLRVYWVSDNESSDQITNPGSPAKHAQGHALWTQSILNQEIDWFAYDPLEFLRIAVHFSRFSFHSGNGAGRQFKALNQPMARFLWLAALPLGYLVYLRDGLKSA